MPKSTFPETANFDREVITCLERQIIPIWERYGCSRLAIATETLEEFPFRNQPGTVQPKSTSKPKRGEAQSKRMYRGSHPIKEWPEENQYAGRFPVLIYVRKGQTEYRVGDYCISCPADHFLFLPPGASKPAHGEPHYEEPMQNKQCELWRFNSTGFEDYVTLSICYSQGHKHHNSGHRYIINNNDAARLLLMFSWEASNNLQYREKLCASILQSFFHLFLREMAEGRFYDRGKEKFPPSVTLTASPIKRAIQYIDKNLNLPLTIDEVAHIVFISRANFTKQFRKETGVTFNEYVTSKRLEEAKYWLTQESCSLEEVCHIIGIKRTRLHQLFRQRLKMTPTEFRNKMQLK